jgi:hypothetical protein
MPWTLVGRAVRARRYLEAHQGKRWPPRSRRQARQLRPHIRGQAGRNKGPLRDGPQADRVDRRPERERRRRPPQRARHHDRVRQRPARRANPAGAAPARALMDSACFRLVPFARSEQFGNRMRREPGGFFGREQSGGETWAAPPHTIGPIFETLNLKPDHRRRWGRTDICEGSSPPQARDKLSRHSEAGGRRLP